MCILTYLPSPSLEPRPKSYRKSGITCVVIAQLHITWEIVPALQLPAAQYDVVVHSCFPLYSPDENKLDCTYNPFEAVVEEANYGAASVREQYAYRGLTRETSFRGIPAAAAAAGDIARYFPVVF